MKMKKNKFKKLSAAILCIALLTACSENTQTQNISETSTVNENIEDTSKVSAQLYEYEDDDYYVDWADQNPIYIKLNGSDITVEGTGATVEGSTVTVNNEGVYVISGKLDDGQIVVNSEDKGKVRLVLNGAEINSSNNASIYVIAGKTVISLEEGTENIVSDGTTYVLEDESTDEPNSAIFSKDDLTFNGTGTITVKGNYNNGITSKDELKITGGNFVISSTDDGLMGRDVVAVKDGDIIIKSGGQGIKTTNDTDTEVGSIYIEGGTFSIESIDDAIHAINGVNIADGEITITTEDDGIHADSFIEISGGAINIQKSYEGIESALITISNGDINVVSSDDGINVAGGNDSSSLNGRPGQNTFSTSSTSDNKLTINGGNVSVNATGDGLDANGSIYMTGGTVVVNGPTSNGNGSLDYDGEFNITGGTLIALGSSGMAQTPSDSSTQNSVMINFTELQTAGTNVHVEDSDGNTILTFEPEKEYQSLVMSSPSLKIDETYTLLINDESTVTFTISKSVMRISDSGEEITGGGMNQMPGGGKGMAPGGGGNRPAPGEEGTIPAPGTDGSMTPQGERPAMPGTTDGATSETESNI